MYAIIADGGRQYKVEEGQELGSRLARRLDRQHAHVRPGAGGARQRRLSGWQAHRCRRQRHCRSDRRHAGRKNLGPQNPPPQKLSPPHRPPLGLHPGEDRKNPSVNIWRTVATSIIFFFTLGNTARLFLRRGCLTRDDPTAIAKLSTGFAAE